MSSDRVTPAASRGGHGTATYHNGGVEGSDLRDWYDTVLAGRLEAEFADAPPAKARTIPPPAPVSRRAPPNT